MYLIIKSHTFLPKYPHWVLVLLLQQWWVHARVSQTGLYRPIHTSCQVLGIVHNFCGVTMLPLILKPTTTVLLWLCY